jgi:hypothetical protein
VTDPLPASAGGEAPPGRPGRAALPLAICALLAVAAPSFPAQVTVDRFDDPALSPGAFCTETPGDCSLRQAMELANLPGEMTILLPPGTYQLTLPGADEDANQTGDLDYSAASALAIIATSGLPTVIQQTGSDRILDLHEGAGSVMLSAVTLTGGDVSAGGGGAIRSMAALLTLHDVVLVDNQAKGVGGCLLIQKAQLLQVAFHGQGLTFQWCGALLGGALGIVQPLGSSGAVVIVGSRFVGNAAQIGGGAIAARFGPGSLLIEDSSFIGNRVLPLDGANGGGGAIYGAGLHLTVRRSAFLDHRAGQPAANAVVGGTLLLEEQTYVAIPPNDPPPPTPSTVRLENVTISRSATSGFAQRGAGIALQDSAVELAHVTLTESRTLGGHAIFAGAPASPTSLTLKASAIDGGCQTFGSPSLSSLGYNVEVPADASPAGTCGLGAQDVVTGDLRVGVPAVYGGGFGVATQPPLPGSALLGLVPAADCLGEDARGAARTLASCDAGAHEIAGTPPGPWIFADGFESGSSAAWSTLAP